MQEPDPSEPPTNHSGPTTRSDRGERPVRSRLALFLAVLVLAAGGAWGAGRVLATQLPATSDPLVDHHFSAPETR